MLSVMLLAIVCWHLILEMSNVPTSVKRFFWILVALAFTFLVLMKAGIIDVNRL